MQIRQQFKRLVLTLAIVCSSGLATLAHSRPARAENPVTHWNAIAIAVLFVDPGLVLDSRGYAIMHAAIHDAVNGIARRYKPYTADLVSPGASVDAAVAAAAHDVLVALSPSQLTTIEAAYVAALAAIPDGPAKEAGIALGRDSARANLDRRADDGLDTVAEPVYVPSGKPGDYDFTPPFDAPPNGPIALLPGLGRVTPFGIRLKDHRLRGPNRLDGLSYAFDYNLLKSIGRLDSSTRTPEQTEIARFWFEFSPIGWNRIATIAIEQKHLDPWQSARLLALVNFALADGYIAGFEAKYHFRFWRPYTAIRRGDEDGNRLTDGDPTWVPLFFDATYFIPPVPDYPSTHTVLGAAAAEVLARLLGDHLRFDMTSTTLPGVTRRFKSFTEAAVENGLSRVYGGIHFLHAVKDGYAQGQGIGRSISRLLPPVHKEVGGRR
jgi:membrane-associated phospholipid phosphatase